MICHQKCGTELSLLKSKVFTDFYSVVSLLTSHNYRKKKCLLHIVLKYYDSLEFQVSLVTALISIRAGYLLCNPVLYVCVCSVVSDSAASWTVAR